MVAWWWLVVAFLGGMASVGVPVLVWLLVFARSWDRSWGWR